MPNHTKRRIFVKAWEIDFVRKGHPPFELVMEAVAESERKQRRKRMRSSFPCFKVKPRFVWKIVTLLNGKKIKRKFRIK